MDATEHASHLSPLLIEEASLASAFRIRRSQFEQKSVDPADVEDEKHKGWELARAGKLKSRLKREKHHAKWLEDRIWCLLYRMGYAVLNGKTLNITLTRNNGSSHAKQIDAYAEDNETSIVVECKSRQAVGRRSLQKDLEETRALQDYLRTYIYQRFSNQARPKIIWIYATSNIVWSQPDKERAEDYGINVVTEKRLEYFEAFIRHMGPAGRYQILGEFLKDQKIPGLDSVILPAIRGKIGGQTYYSFVATPRNLLKIAFINHHALDHPDGQPAYQRMISSARIKRIAQFIRNGGYFPTNILVNFRDSPRFDLISNKDKNSDPNTKFGWITLPSRYRSAWIIDGQHRLYGFSHLSDDQLDQSLFVLAFDKMPARNEADLFITINHEQKSVPRSHLVSLLPDLSLEDSDPSKALTALASAIQRSLGQNPMGPLWGRFATPGMPKQPNQSLTNAEIVTGIQRSGLVGIVADKGFNPGALSGDTNSSTIQRATQVLNAYFQKVRAAHPQRWERGRTAFIATNVGIRSHLVVISEVISYLSHKRSMDFRTLSADKFASLLTDFCEPLFAYFRTASDSEMEQNFARLYGEGGVRTYSYRLLDLIAEISSDFGSEDFRRWREQRDSEQINDANQFLMKLSERMTNFVINTLKDLHGTNTLPSGERAFWEIGVESQRVRKNAYDKQQKDDSSRRRPKEAYLDIVDFIDIVKQKNNWPEFEATINNPQRDERGGKKYYLDWIQQFNILRNIAAHKNEIRTYSEEDLEFVEWLRSEVSPKFPGNWR